MDTAGRRLGGHVYDCDYRSGGADLRFSSEKPLSNGGTLGYASGAVRGITASGRARRRWPAMKSADPVTSHLLSPRERPSRLSLVIPIYNEEAVIAVLREAVQGFAHALPGEIELVLVNDGSSDQTLAL